MFESDLPARICRTSLSRTVTKRTISPLFQPGDGNDATYPGRLPRNLPPTRERPLHEVSYRHDIYITAERILLDVSSSKLGFTPDWIPGDELDSCVTPHPVCQWLPLPFAPRKIFRQTPFRHHPPVVVRRFARVTSTAVFTSAQRPL